ncbi:hypothetical protein NTE_03242 [Candidatus Nitrososphaera evergladensis SR1]|jgi:hypothetical protein|uniref:Uncharacterized protein n=1 Tax=Candidatus Nitrososphaera evergladensis SR1 TaxID=1459636 RepID=A0A075MUE2_9ARCH|nr:hypothetical protein [Candidatus Nitrososphaera evergladensis]AIF85271.1 hypothetical protein NTE_03242 [Candidatus Nitrososphaera evergladensis SR1]
MKVELEMYINEDDESAVMNKVSEITKHVKELGFKIGELEFKNKEEGEDNHHRYKGKEKGKEDKKRRRHN